MLRRLALSLFILAACAPPELRVGAKQGIPAITGSTEVSLDSFVCGDPIPAGDTTVTTRKVSGGCELSFSKDVEIVKASDYSNIPELKGASNLVQSVELVISTLSFTDTTTGTPLDVATRIRSVTLSINGQQVADKAALSSLPKTVSLTGDALSRVKAQVDKRQPATVTATCVAVLPDDPAPPKSLKIDYDAQPTLVLGTGELKLPQ